jgi:acetoin utilization deacetylase AcuC-like enzyme
MATSYITHADCLKHEMGAGHPECPDRLIAINEYMRTSGLLEQLRVLDAPLASPDDLKRVHRSAFVDLIFENAPTEGYVQLDPDTAMNPYTLLRSSTLMSITATARRTCSARPIGRTGF